MKHNGQSGLKILRFEADTAAAGAEALYERTFLIWNLLIVITLARWRFQLTVEKCDVSRPSPVVVPRETGPSATIAQLAYFSDEANVFTAQQMLDQATLAAIVQHSVGGPADVDPTCSGLLVDVDHLTEEVAALWIAWLSTRSTTVPIVVHGYDIDDGLAARLRTRGISVCRQLMPLVLIEFAVASGARRAAAA